MAELVPAILTNDVNDFRKQYAELFALSHYFKRLHVDFIDGEYLPNKTLTMDQLDFLDSSFVLGAHFMTLNPKQYFEEAKKIGFEWGLFHLDVFNHEQEILNTIGEAERLGLKTALALNPSISLHSAAEFLDKVHAIQIMGVHPGAQGRAFDEKVIEKVRELKSLKKNAIISVDGGVSVQNAKQLVQAGADILVVGSAIAKSQNKKQTIEELLREIK
jgi:ribulose-phosphate 3-epimerase